MKRLGIVVLLAFMLMITGCGKSSTIKIVTEEKTYLEADQVIANLENAGYTVERTDRVEGLNVEIDRIKAVNGDKCIDICYEVSSMEDMDLIIEYYMDHYKKYNLVSASDIVFCYSDDSVVDDSGLQ